MKAGKYNSVTLQKARAKWKHFSLNGIKAYDRWREKAINLSIFFACLPMIKPHQMSGLSRYTLCYVGTRKKHLKPFISLALSAWVIGIKWQWKMGSDSAPSLPCCKFSLQEDLEVERRRAPLPKPPCNSFRVFPIAKEPEAQVQQGDKKSLCAFCGSWQKRLFQPAHPAAPRNLTRWSTSFPWQLRIALSQCHSSSSIPLNSAEKC